jgi:uncharacterized protein (TIGR02302 family)
VKPPAFGKGVHAGAFSLVTWLRLAQLVLLTERLGSALWPAATVAVLLLSAALIGLPANLPAAPHAALLISCVAASLFLGFRGWRRMLAPGPGTAERRLERDSGLSHRPLAALRDRPAGTQGEDDPFWRLHQARARAALRQLRLRGPDPVIAAQDPFALRSAAALLLVAGAVMAGPQARQRVAALLLPSMGGAAQTQTALVQAWIMPPPYTGLPPLFLAQGATKPIEVPENSRLTVSITGVSAEPEISLGGVSHPMEALGGDNFQSAFSVSQSGRLRVGGLVSALAGWDIRVLPNTPPVIAWAALPGRAGTSLSTRFPWRVSQRWGVASLQAELAPQGHADLPKLILPLALNGTPKQGSGAAELDLVSNPYAGLPMSARLTGKDVSGQSGTSETVTFILPARDFKNPLAKAIVEARRRLALHPDAPQDVAGDLAALAEAKLPPKLPDGLPGSGVILNLAAASAVLGGPHPAVAAIAEVEARLWTLALALDGGLPDENARALAVAQERMKRALEDHAAGRLSDKALQQRLEELRQALDKRMADIAKDAMQHGALEKFDPRTQHLSSARMDRLMRQMEKAMREGRTQDAQHALAELQKMFDQLKNAHVMSKQEMQARQQQQQRGQQMMGAVQDLVRRESALLDHAQARAPQTQPGAQPFRGYDLLNPPGALEAPDTTPQSGQALPDPGQLQENAPDDMSAAAPPSAQGSSARTAPPASQKSDARTQRALHRALDAMAQGFAESGGKKPPSLDEAGQAMGDASQSLDHHDDPMARDAEGRAIAALQQGAQDMARQMQSNSPGEMQLSLQQSGGSEGSGAGQDGDDDQHDGQGGHRKDPFGRQVDGNGALADDPNLRVPDEMEQARSRAIQEELRRRGADRQRPQEELDYIERLLKTF